jgi:hypothetical protein
MFPPLFATLFASAPVKAIFGSAPLRVYAFGDAPAKGAPGYLVPYAVFQTVFGNPENYLNQTPDLDRWGVQVDVYALTLTAARNGAEAIRNALEPVAYVTAWNGELRDTDTQLFRYSFDVSFQTPR